MGCDKQCKCQDNIIDFLCPRYDYLYARVQAGLCHTLPANQYFEQRGRLKKERKEDNEKVKKEYKLIYEEI